MQNQRYWKLPLRTCGRYIVSGLPCRQYSVCSSRTNSPSIQLARYTPSPVMYGPDNVWKSISRNLHPPTAAAPPRSCTHSSVALKQKQLKNFRSYSDSRGLKSSDKTEMTKTGVASLAESIAESVYQRLVKTEPWLYPYSRMVAFSQSRNSRMMKHLRPKLRSQNAKALLNKSITTDSVKLLTVEEMSSVFRDLTHAGLEETHPLMTNLFLQLQSKQGSLDFVSLGQFLSAIENYNSSHIIMERDILPQLQYLLQNGYVKLDKDPKLFLDVLCQFSSCGLLQQTDSALISDLLLQILSLCRDHISIWDDLDLVVPVFQLVSVFMLGDHRLAFIESNIQHTSEMILRHVTEVMSANIQQLNLYHLCAITAMSAEEHLEFLSKPFLEEVQSRIESIMLETQHFSTYNILQLEQLANLSWIQLPAKCQDRILSLTLGCLENPVYQPLPVEMVIFLTRSRAISDLLYGDKISVSAKASLKRAVFDVDIVPHLQSNDFIRLFETMSLYFSSVGEQVDFSLQCLSKLSSKSLLDMTDRLRYLHFVVLANKPTNLLRSLSSMFNATLGHCYNLNEFKKLINITTSVLKDTYYQNVVPSWTKLFITIAVERTQAQNGIRQFFLLGYDLKRSSRMKLCGMPGWRLQQEFLDLFRPCMFVRRSELRDKLSSGLTCLYKEDMDPEEFQMVCCIARALSPSINSQFQCNILEYFIKHQADMKINNFIDVLQISLKIGPKDVQQRLIETANDFMKQLSIDAVEPGVLFEMLCSLSDVRAYPKQHIIEVFQTPYITRVMDLLQSPELSYNQSKSLLNNLVKLNRRVCLLCPDYAVPFQQKLIEAHPEQPCEDDVQDISIYIAQKQAIQDKLIVDLGGIEFVRKNHITSEGLHIDMVAYFDEDCNGLKCSELDVMKMSGKPFTRIAVLFLHKDHYLWGSKLISIDFESNQKKAMLRAKGYKVVVVYCFKKEKYNSLLERAQRAFNNIRDAITHEVW